MKIIQNKLLPPKGFGAIMLFGFLLTRDASRVSARTLRHERIHVRQMWELLVVGFYLWYFVEWTLRLLMAGNAYRNLSFEREAYGNQDNENYLTTRKPFAWIKYVKGK